VTRRIPLIAGGVIVVLLLGWYVAVWRPSGSHLREAQSSLAAAAIHERSLAASLGGLSALQRSLPSDVAKLRQAEAAVPSTPSIATLLFQVDAMARAEAITLTNESQSLSAVVAATPTATTTEATTSSTTIAAAPSSTSSDSVVTLSLQVTGSYSDMGRFITDLQSGPRLIVIDTVTYTPGAGSTVSVTMTTRAFYNPAANPVLPADNGGS
jgi:Tfp pilus assembly protein PilO